MPLNFFCETTQSKIKQTISAYEKLPYILCLNCLRVFHSDFLWPTAHTLWSFFISISFSFDEYFYGHENGLFHDTPTKTRHKILKRESEQGIV